MATAVATAPATPPVKGTGGVIRFRPPEAYKGQIVLWHASGQSGPDGQPAIVTNVGETTLKLAVLVEDQMSIIPKDGVRHVDDPLINGLESIRENGAWEHTPETEEYEKIKAAFRRSQNKA